MARKDLKELYDINTNSAELLNKEETAEKETYNSWDEFFEGYFPSPLNFPRNTTMLIRRHLPYDHPLNPVNVDIEVPIMFGMDDLEQNRWLIYLYDSSVNKGSAWSFLLLKPNPDVYLNYLSGDLTLQDVYNSARNNMFVSTPDISKNLTRINMDSLPESAIPVQNSKFNEKIWIDQTDVFFGMNMENVENVIELAKSKRFY